MKPHELYLIQLEELREKINTDFDFYRDANSRIDRRLNELGKRGNIEQTAGEMAMLLDQRAKVKDVALKLLPLRDLFKGLDVVNDRLTRLAQFDR